MRIACTVLLLGACGAPAPDLAETARERAYRLTRQYDDAPLDLSHYQPLILTGFQADPDEPIAPSLSLPKAKRFLDSVSLAWTRQNKCGTCHTNLPYLVARPHLGPMTEPAATEIREWLFSFLEALRRPTVAATAGAAPPHPETPRGRVYLRLPIASMLAVGDGIAGESDPRTRGEFDRVWTMQRPDGSFYWPTGGGMLPFLERDADYIAALVALGAGYLPASYLATPAASAGLERTVSFLKSQPASDLHAEMILLWASVRTPGLMDSSQRDRTIARVRALQRPDGGWSLPSFGNWRRHDGPPNDPIDGPSDGYATGLAALVLCETGAGGADSSVQRGLAWLRGNQRASGRWFTRSLYSDQFQHYLSNMATTYAVIALQTCDPREPR